jgi:hypothetical protein
MMALRELIVQRGPAAQSPPGEVSERPIAFNDEMVKALLAGRKTETRRPVAGRVHSSQVDGDRTILLDRAGKEIVCPMAAPGDRLWVRERWAQTDDGEYRYFADGDDEAARWRPSIRMPREASRLVLSVRAVSAQKLQDVSENQARSEGCPNDREPLEWFRELWGQIYHEPKLGWKSNPWVWVIQFE